MTRLYDEAGRRVLSDRELDVALGQYRIDYPKETTPHYRQIEHRIRRLNDEAREREAAEAAGTTVHAMRQVKAERDEARREADRLADLQRARVAQGKSAPMTPYAMEKIGEIRSIYDLMRRNGGGRPSDSALAKRVNVDRGTIAAWRARGWLKIPQ